MINLAGTSWKTDKEDCSGVFGKLCNTKQQHMPKEKAQEGSDNRLARRGKGQQNLSTFGCELYHQHWDYPVSLPGMCRITSFHSCSDKIQNRIPPWAAPALKVPGKKQADVFNILTVPVQHHQMTLCTCKRIKCAFCSLINPKCRSKVENV